MAQLYDQLSGTPGPSELSRKHAAAKNWPAPLAWDDIDHDPAPSAPVETDETRIDEMAVVRAVSGDPPRVLRSEDRLAAYVKLARAGVPSAEIADRLQVTTTRVQQDRNLLEGRARRARQAVS